MHVQAAFILARYTAALSIEFCTKRGNNACGITLEKS